MRWDRVLTPRPVAPIYEKLADAFPGGKVIIAKTDADGVGRDLGTKFGIQGFPSECADVPSGR